MLKKKKTTKKEKWNKENFTFFLQKLHHVADRLPQMLHQKSAGGKTKKDMLKKKR